MDKSFFELRIYRGFGTQEELARASMVDIDTIGKIERGTIRNPRKDTKQKLALAMGVELPALIQAIECSKAQRVIKHADNASDDYALRYEKCEKEFQTLSSQNAHCDVDIFNTLFGDIKPGNEEGRQARRVVSKACQHLIRVNLRDLLDTLRELFRTMMGTECSACIQVFKDREGGKPCVETFLWDKISGAYRSTNQASQEEVKGNTIYEQVFRDKILETGVPLIFNDIAQHINRRELSVPKTSIVNKYNSIFIVRVPLVKSEETQSVTVITVFNQEQFRSDRVRVCGHFASELAWRVSAMLYRLYILMAEGS